MNLVIIDYGSGNLRSAQKAFAYQAALSDKPFEVIVSAAPDAVARADYVVLPGVGAFADCLQGLRDINGMAAALDEAVIGKARPFLGICVGMQLMCARGLERGTHQGFGWVNAEVAPLDVPDGLKVPHMGWNNIRLARPHKLFDGLDGTDMYFVHSYAARFEKDDMIDIIATSDYGQPIVAALGHDNMVGTQFHPEKSQHAGLRLIANFLEWRP